MRKAEGAYAKWEMKGMADTGDVASKESNHSGQGVCAEVNDVKLGESDDQRGSWGGHLVQGLVQALVLQGSGLIVSLIRAEDSHWKVVHLP